MYCKNVKDSFHRDDKATKINKLLEFERIIIIISNTFQFFIILIRNLCQLNISWQPFHKIAKLKISISLFVCLQAHIQYVYINYLTKRKHGKARTATTSHKLKSFNLFV